MGRYIDALCREAELRKCELNGETVKTIYIGGGTPSLLSAGQLSALVDALRMSFDTTTVEEFTIEVNPDDIDAGRVATYSGLGINRVSMGVQSFVDSELKFLNRRHDAAGAVDAFRTIRAGGIDNISIDLIFGIPGQTMQSWQRSLDAATDLNPQHISCYNLSYEEGTQLYRMRSANEIQELDDNECVKMYESLVAHLDKHGYEHYEISNFALPGCYSRHNSSYWDKTPYLGLGASAHSYTGGVRRYNLCNASEYVSKLELGKVVAIAEEESVSECYDEEVMLRLRTAHGIDAELIRAAYGELYYSHFMREVRQFVSTGLVTESGSNYRLSKRGVMLADMIIRELMYV